jgi:hypothetical protein
MPPIHSPFHDKSSTAACFVTGQSTGLKALGSVVTNFYAESSADLLSTGMTISMGLSVGLLYVSHWVGIKFNALMASGLVIGNDEAVQKVSISVEDNTSCALTPSSDSQSDDGKQTTVSV